MCGQNQNSLMDLKASFGFQANGQHSKKIYWHDVKWNMYVCNYIKPLFNLLAIHIYIYLTGGSVRKEAVSWYKKDSGHQKTHIEINTD